MAFLLFLIVSVISYNHGMARPASGDVKITQNGVNSNGDENLSDEIFILPAVVKPGLTITVNGVLNTSEESFKVTLRNIEESNDDCRIMFDFRKGTIQTTSADNYNEDDSYLLGANSGGNLKFQLRIKARNHGILALFLQVQDLGPSPQMHCEVTSLKNIKYMEMKEGVQHIDRILFEFN